MAMFLLPGTAARAQEDCTECHEVDLAAFGETPHGFLECVDCHTSATELPHPEPAEPADCSMCHDEVLELYRSSVHGSVKNGDREDAADCLSCHGKVHTLVPYTDPESPVHPRNLAETCGSCHANPELVRDHGIAVAKPLEAYRSSVHARLGEEEDGANCSSCHGSHGILHGSHPDSTVNHTNLPETCGQCHAEITEAYTASVHGVALARGVRESPVCTDCHGEHRILSPTERGSPVYATNVPKMTCGRCHSDLRLAEKFGLAQDKVPAYEDSYHGLAMRAGNATVANCASCHGVHDILASTDPGSHTYPEQLAVTCGQCHEGAGTRFTIGPVHVQPTEREHTVVYWARLVYLWIIYLTVGGMVLHNGLDLWRKVRVQTARTAAGRPSPERMSRGFRIAHVALMTSFGVLVYTGFALTYPESWWARPVLAWEEKFGLRGWLHRIAAVVMLGALAFHVVHLAVDRRARRVIRNMRPAASDLRELVERMRWYLGLRKTPPKAPALGYPEKLEYIALVWGLLVMTVSGLLLWFDDLLLRLLPSWVANLATVIHFYEAVLATLAIVVWHLYFVIFDPVVYPMDRAWLTGRSHPGRVAEREPQRAGGTE
jgi:cytochrome b subunit of formate dehydrogenase